jgi:hypothetical protein
MVATSLLANVRARASIAVPPSDKQHVTRLVGKDDLKEWKDMEREGFAGG